MALKDLRSGFSVSKVNAEYFDCSVCGKRNPAHLIQFDAEGKHFVRFACGAYCIETLRDEYRNKVFQNQRRLM